MDILQTIVDSIVKKVDAKKADDIRVFSVADTNWLTDYVIIIGASNKIHSKALVNELLSHLTSIVREHSRHFYDPMKISGSPESGWVILDINSIVIHCVDTEKREHYKLDEVFEKQGSIYHY